jgi:hypothetical protein
MSAIADKAVHGKPVVPHWETMFECLVEFRENEGHLDVPINYKCHDESLATWLQSQRSLQRRLSQEKIDRLVSIGVDFERGNVGSLPETVDDREGNEHDKPRTSRELRNDARWSLMVQGLVEFKEKNGHLRVKKAATIMDKACTPGQTHSDNAIKTLSGGIHRHCRSLASTVC